MGHAVKGCPGDLDATGKARWQLVRGDFGTGWEDVYAATLERYVRYLAMADAAIEDMCTVTDDNGNVHKTNKPVLTALGSKGQPAQHPSWKTYLEASRGAADAAEALRLTPRARARAGESKGPEGPGKFGGAFG